MADNFGNQIFSRGTTRTIDQATYDVGLRKHMLSVYNYMASGLALSGIVAILVYSVPALKDAFYVATPVGLKFSILGWIAMLAPLIMTFGIGAVMRSSSQAANIFYWVFVSLMGVGLSTIFFVYPAVSIVRVFFITAAAFAGLSIYGYTTKRDLSGVGRFLIMGLIGLIIAMLVNAFFANFIPNMLISAIGVFIFAGLTAYDTQAIKEQYNENFDGSTNNKLAIFGALLLYLNFINLFQFLLAIFGGNRN